jgi:hypothetical protein
MFAARDNILLLTSRISVELVQKDHRRDHDCRSLGAHGAGDPDRRDGRDDAYWRGAR